MEFDDLQVFQEHRSASNEYLCHLAWCGDHLLLNDQICFTKWKNKHLTWLVMLRFIVALLSPITSNWGIWEICQLADIFHKISFLRLFCHEIFCKTGDVLSSTLNNNILLFRYHIRLLCSSGSLGEKEANSQNIFNMLLNHFDQGTNMLFSLKMI